jgi:3-hydroxyisobutyrate dehydrogenase-like beta-hydroxyacid dehydrogenase
MGMAKPRIGFIGIGLMGGAIVQRMLDLGYPLMVLGNTNRTGVQAALRAGATEAAGAADLAANSDIVMLCMGTSDQVESRIYGPDGVLAGANSGTVVIDFGTSLPASTKRIAVDMAAKGVDYMDAPLGRTPSHALEGKLNIMAAGPAALFARVQPVLQDLGENVFHVGPIGAGHTLKLINNFFSMTTATAMAEAFAMADLAGLPRQNLYDVLAAGPNRSTMMDFIKAQAIDGENKLAFSISNAAKDLGYYTQMAVDMNAVSMIATGPKASLDLAKSLGWGDKMVPEMVDFFAGEIG